MKTHAEKDLAAIKKAGAEEDYERGNRIIRDRNVWKQGGSMFGMASYDYWDGSHLEWRPFERGGREGKWA